jgi:hypothetical protein
MKPAFRLGTLLTTPDVLELVDREDFRRALERHARGEWGDCSAQVREANERGLKERGELLSVYFDRQGVKFSIRTAEDRQTTTVTLSEKERPRYEASIDRTDFGIVAGYLKSPHSPIQWLLHVRDEKMLSQVAEQIEHEHRLGLLKAGELPLVAKRHLKERSMLVSARESGQVFEANRIDPEKIPSSASCKVIYLEPYYLVHTPGLFEGRFGAASGKSQEVKAPERTKSETGLDRGR